MTTPALTAPLTLRLATPEGLAAGLLLLGLAWEPAAFPTVVALPEHAEPGLYTWTAGSAGEALQRPVLYVGIGKGVADGFPGRLRKEWSWVGEDWIHGHGRGVHRLAATPCGGPVLRTDADLSFVEHWRDGAAAACAWLEATAPVAAAEAVAIRLALHLGDTPPPLNSQHTSAWSTESPADVLGYAAARELLAPHRPPPGAVQAPPPDADVEADSTAEAEADAA
ncbi:MAG: hypothetical protein JWO60_2572 [Frankiales bacterium]|nr:hypothetical protein [Frankiales bacterium]